MASERMNRILEDNIRFAKQAPYNFCDRWCERCPSFIQRHCSLYQQQMEEKITCIAHGREEDDLEVLKEVTRWHHEALDMDAGFPIDELVDIDLDDPEFETIKKHVTFVERHPLRKVADDYRRKAHLFLEISRYRQEAVEPRLKEHFETLDRYHTLLPAKLNRALCGYHEPVAEGDISMHDAIAQFAVCKKAAQLSLSALTQLKTAYPMHGNALIELRRLLQGILSLVLKMEEAV